jgi:hypothetical protein
MVLTGAVRNSDAGHTRRWVLGAGLAVTALSGCGVIGDDDPEPPRPPDALQPLADEALALAAAYDRAVLTRPDLAARLAPLAEDHRAHAAELVRVIGSPATAPVPAAPSGAATGGATGGATGSAAGDPIAALRAAEQTAARNAVTACATTTAERAGLVGSIAACRATHVEALR